MVWRLTNIDHVIKSEFIVDLISYAYFGVQLMLSQNQHQWNTVSQFHEQHNIQTDIAMKSTQYKQQIIWKQRAKSTGEYTEYPRHNTEYRKYKNAW